MSAAGAAAGTTASVSTRNPFGYHVPDGASKISLALSGGGIRSATTCTGVLCYLHATGLEAGIDALSCVSGGGYVGSSYTLSHPNHRRDEDGKEATPETWAEPAPHPASGSHPAAAAAHAAGAVKHDWGLPYFRRFLNNGNYLCDFAVNGCLGAMDTLFYSLFFVLVAFPSSVFMFFAPAYVWVRGHRVIFFLGGAAAWHGLGRHGARCGAAVEACECSLPTLLALHIIIIPYHAVM